MASPRYELLSPKYSQVNRFPSGHALCFVSHSINRAYQQPDNMLQDQLSHYRSSYFQGVGRLRQRTQSSSGFATSRSTALILFPVAAFQIWVTLNYMVRRPALAVVRKRLPRLSEHV